MDVSKTKFVVLGLSCMLMASCSAKDLGGCRTKGDPSCTQVTKEIVIQEPVRTAPGVVEYVWEEPMVDVVEIPPGLDPDGVYYRPAHQSIVEIRQGRWKYYKPKQ